MAEEKLQKLPTPKGAETPEVKEVELDKKRAAKRAMHDDDGACECRKEKAEEETKEHKKEAGKELLDKAKEAEKINTAEAPKMKKFKGMVEKLTLEEPSDALNESLEDYSPLDVFDLLIDEVGIEPRELLDHVINWLPTDELKDLVSDFVIDNDLEDLFESMKEDLREERPFREEQQLDEKIPRDLAKAYRAQNYRGKNGRNTDLENSTYTELTPEEALKEIKAGNARSLRLIINDHVVDLKDDGWGTTNGNRVKYVPYDQYYTTKSGNTISDTAKMPGKYLVQIASKIYKTDEADKIRDTEQSKERSKNPESPNYSGDKVKTGYDRWTAIRGGEIGYASSPSSIIRYKEYIKYYEERIAKAKEEIDRNGDPDDYLKGRIEYYQREIDDYKSRLIKAQGDMKDVEANNRYTASALKLREPYEQYRQIKSDLEHQKDRLSSASDKLAKAKAEGSEFTRKNKEKYQDLLDDLKRIKRQMASIELELEDADEEDAKAMKAEQKDVDDLTVAVDELQKRMNTLLGKK